jgi:hypothetical protein
MDRILFTDVRAMSTLSHWLAERTNHPVKGGGLASSAELAWCQAIKKRRLMPPVWDAETPKL